MHFNILRKKLYSIHIHFGRTIAAIAEIIALNDINILTRLNIASSYGHRPTDNKSMRFNL